MSKTLTFSQQLTKSIGGDEYYTLKESVDMIIPYILKYKDKVIWCPFDKEDSNFVKILIDKGFKVNYGHIDTGQDFFNYQKPRGEIVVSNPPFSKRNEIFEKLYKWDLPFALIINYNGLFDSKKRIELFSKHRVELLIPIGRMKFIKEDGAKNNPNFQSIYVCNKILDNQIVFDKTNFFKIKEVM